MKWCSATRSEQKLKRLARKAPENARAGTPDEAAEEADALLLAVHWSRIEDVLHQAGDLSGKRFGRVSSRLLQHPQDGLGKPLASALAGPAFARGSRILQPLAFNMAIERSGLVSERTGSAHIKRGVA